MDMKSVYMAVVCVYDWDARAGREPTAIVVILFGAESNYYYVTFGYFIICHNLYEIIFLHIIHKIYAENACEMERYKGLNIIQIYFALNGLM